MDPLPAPSSEAGTSSAAPGPPPVLGHIDVPRGGTLTGRTSLLILGWALGRESPVSRVEILLDGELAGRAGLGRPRTDVAIALNDPDAELSGFELRVDAARLALLSDCALLSARVTLLDGTSASLGPVEIRLGQPSPPMTHLADRGEAKFFGRRSLGGRIRLLCFARALDYGGSQLRLRELMQHLQTTGSFETTVVSPVEGPLRLELEAAGVDVRIAPICFDTISLYEEQLATLREWAAGRFDIVLAATLTSFAGVDLADRLNLPAVWRIGESEALSTVVEWLGEALDPEVDLRATRAFATASVVLFNSEHALRAHTRINGPARFAVFGTGTDIAGAQAYLRSVDREALRQTLAIGADQRVLICAGTIWPIKGQTQLATALARARIDRSRLQLILIGQSNEPYLHALSRSIARLELVDCVRVLPFCPDLRPWLVAADAAICSSESESMPASILEAMAFGLPVLACNVGGVPEVVIEDATGWLCEANDLGSLIGGLERMSATPSVAIRRLGEHARELVRRAHDRSAALKRMTDLLTQVSSGSY